MLSPRSDDTTRYQADTEDFYWNKPAQSSAGNYPLGFGPLGLRLRMEKWVVPTTNVSVQLGQSSSGFDFALGLADNLSTGGIADYLAVLPAGLNMSSTNVVTVTDDAAAAPTWTQTKGVGNWAKAWVTKITPKTGAFTGKFIVKDTVTVGSKTTTVTRTVAYQGVLLQLPSGDTDAFGQGYFLLPSLTSGVTPTSGGIQFLTP